MTETIVVLGGSFNPPTIAHRLLLETAMKSINATEGIFVPSSNKYVLRKMRKERSEEWLISEQNRLELLCDACKSTDMNITVSTCEFGDDGRGHTYDTMCRLQEIHPDAKLYCLIGADKLAILPKWHNHNQFFKNFNFAVVSRAGTDAMAEIRNNEVLSKYEDIFAIIPEPGDIGHISSSNVRVAAMRKDFATLEAMLDTEVLRYLKCVWKL